MAQKQQRSVDPLRAKASEMRLAQQRAERRTRIIVISAVGLIVLAIIAAVGGVIWQQQSEVSAARNVEPSDVLGVYADRATHCSQRERRVRPSRIPTCRRSRSTSTTHAMPVLTSMLPWVKI